MKGTRPIQAYFLIFIYTILLLHDVVPHSHTQTHTHSQTQTHSHSQTHTHTHTHTHDHATEEEELATLGFEDFLENPDNAFDLWHFLQNLLHSHAEIGDAQHHDLAYKANSAELPVWTFSGIVVGAYLPLVDIHLPSRSFVPELCNFYWQSQGLHSPKCLRAPPVLC